MLCEITQHKEFGYWIYGNIFLAIAVSLYEQLLWWFLNMRFEARLDNGEYIH